MKGTHLLKNPDTKKKIEFAKKWCEARKIKYRIIEISNTTPNPANIYSNEGIAQFLFLKGNEQPETTYKSRGGKYQGQTTIQKAKIK